MGSSFVVYFDGSLWVGLVEVADPDGSVRVARHVFGAEPGAAELWEFVCTRGGDLIDKALRAPAVVTEQERRGQRVNPKRAARLAVREAARQGPSTAAQAALTAARDAAAGERRAAQRSDDDDARRRRRAVGSAKRTARHRGH